MHGSERSLFKGQLYADVLHNDEPQMCTYIVILFTRLISVNETEKACYPRCGNKK